MTANQFRALALRLPEAAESSHMGHPDFRVNGKIFATLWPDGDHGMVKLKPEQQRRVVQANPDVFTPVKGEWGARGATQVRLDAADKATLQSALLIAWRNTAPKQLVDEFDADEP